MPEKKTTERARKDRMEGESPSTQAGEYVREEMEHIREGKHGAANTKQAIAIGLSKARRSGVPLRTPKGSKATRTKAKRDTARSKTRTKTSGTRSRATRAALKRKPRKAASTRALSRQGRSAAQRRPRSARRASAKRAARTRARASR
jgi:hypothetical protein